MTSHGGFLLIIALLSTECKCYFDILHNLELKILEYQPIAYINPKREQCDGNLGYDTGIVVLYKSVVATDINDGTEHSLFLRKNPPLETRGGSMLGLSPCTSRPASAGARNAP